MAKRLAKSFMRRLSMPPTGDQEAQPPLNDAPPPYYPPSIPDYSPPDSKEKKGCRACSSSGSLKSCLNDWDFMTEAKATSPLYTWRYNPNNRVYEDDQQPPCEMCPVIQKELDLVNCYVYHTQNLMECLRIYIKDQEEQAKQLKARKKLTFRSEDAEAQTQPFPSMTHKSDAVGLKSFKHIFDSHPGSEYCALCKVDSEHPDLGSLDWALSRLNPAGVAQIIEDHSIPWIPGWKKRNLIEQVRIRLEEEGTWKGLAFQEYEIDVSTPRRAYRQQSQDEVLYVPISAAKPGYARPVDRTFDMSLINKWLEKCHCHHGSRCSVQTTTTQVQDLFLIDTEKNCLVKVSQENVPPYFALSYVWGRIPQAELTTAKVNAWQEENSLKKVRHIPQKVRDAMTIAKTTGRRYLWVDALCIIQDNAIERSKQINQMYLIYHHAEATIIAADGPRSDEGLSGVSRCERREQIGKAYEILGTPMARIPRDLKSMLQASEWRKRGWTFQEEICSTRAIIFLPSIVYFSCPTAVWREDLCLEDVDAPRMDCGLNSLPAGLGDGSATADEKITTFREMVNHYMRRKLTRPDDMENAFIGISDMVENFVGPIYHGIPEKYFAQVISGCWFWNMCCTRQPGFPSWSWTGWSYTKEQADAGIAPRMTPGETAGLLTFFKFGHTVQEFQAAPERAAPTSALDSLRPELRSHFNPELPLVQSRHALLLSQAGEVPRGLLCFYTSFASLNLRPLHHFASSSAREYLVLNPKSGKTLTTLSLEESDVNEHAVAHPFIVIASRPKRAGQTGGLRLMLIKEVEGVCYKVNVTSPGSLVSESDWWDLGPSKRMVLMG